MQNTLFSNFKRGIDTMLLLYVDVFVMYVCINLILTVKFKLVPMRAYPIVLANILFVMAAYSLNKIADHAEDSFNDDKHLSINKNAVFIATALLVTLGVFFYATVGGISFVLYGLLIALLSIWYSFPKNARLKNYLIIKNLTPAFCWYFSICILFYAGGVFLTFPQVLYYLSPFLLLFFAFEVIWDLPDREGDMHSGVKTLPIAIGLRYTRLIICAFLAIVFLLAVSRLNKIMCFALLLFILFVPEKSRKITYHYFLCLLATITIIVYFLLATVFYIPPTPHASNHTQASTTIPKAI